MRKHTGMIVGLAALGLLLLTVAVAPRQPWRSQERALPRPSAEPGVAVPDLSSALAEQRARIEDAPQINARAKRKLLARLEGRSQPKRPDKPGEAARFYLRKRVQADGTFPVARYAQAAPRFRSRPNLAGVAPFSAGTVQTGSAQTGALVNPTWNNIGPGNVGGRVRALLAIDAGASPDVLVAGGVSGGIWKSSDGGASWLPKDDLMANLAVSTLAVDPADSQVLYAGTGEGYDVYPDITDGERSLKRGAGIFVSIDQGESWLSMLSTVAATGTPSERDFRFVNKIVVSPTTPNTLYAATNTDLWVSTDGGDTWVGLFTQVLSGFGERAVLDLAVVDKAGFDHAYLWVAGRGLYVHSFGGTPPASGYVVGSASESSEFHRGVIAVDPLNAGTAYVAVSRSASTFSDPLAYTIQGLYKITNFTTATPVLDLTSGTAESNLSKLVFSNPIYAYYNSGTLNFDCSGAPYDPGAYAQGWYDMAIAVDPADSSRIWLGGIDLFRSDDGGVTFQMASTWWLNDSYSSFTHADQHVIVFAPGYDGLGNTRMYFGNDGGIWKSDNAFSGTLATDACHDTPTGAFDEASLPAIDYTALNNGLGITQFWHGTVATTADIAAGGTQDNGTIASNVPATGQSTDPDAWSTLAGGDGGYAFFDPTDATTLYQAYYYIDIRRHTLNINGSTGDVTSFYPADNAPIISGGINQGSAGLFINPYLLDASYPWRLYVTNDRLWVTDNAKTASPVAWRNLGILRPLQNGQSSGINGSALAIAPSDPQVLYVGMEDGSVVRVNCTDAVLVAGSTTGGPAGGDGAPQIAATASGPSRNGAWAVAAGLACLLLLTARVAAGGARRPSSQMAALPLLIAALLAVGSCVSSESTTSSSTTPGGTVVGCNTYVIQPYKSVAAGFISSLTVHPTTPGTVFATVSTFGERHLWKSTDSGATWTALDDSNADGDVLDVGDIPDIPAHTLFIDPQNTDELYLGTDLGVLYSADGGGTWMSINTIGMANVVVETLAYRAATRTLYAFTHGRGVFALTLP